MTEFYFYESDSVEFPDTAAFKVVKFKESCSTAIALA